MKKILLFFFLVSSYGLFAQTNTVNTTKSFATYRDLSPYTQASPVAFKSSLYGFLNPSIVNYNRSSSELLITLYDKFNDFNNYSNYGFFYGADQTGFGALFQKDDLSGKYIVDYRYSLGFGSRDFSMGVSHGFVGGDKGYFGRANTFSIGMTSRPSEYLSFGLSYITAYNNSDEETVAEIALRPFGNSYPLTLFADVSTYQFRNYDNALWSGGVSWEFLKGLRLNGRYFDNKSLSVGLDISFGDNGVSILRNENDGNSRQSYSVRLLGKDRSIFDDINVPQYYIKMNLAGKIKYQNYKYFDNSRTLLSIINRIDKAEKDKTVKGIVINAIGMSTSKALLWEIRERLRKFKMSGKKVIIFIERVGIDQYHFASVADKIVMDELGSLSISGYSMSRSYYKNMLEKVGIGFDELRFFKYKSAYESFSELEYSEADREQRQALIDSWYTTTKKEVAKERKVISEAKFDELVDQQIFYFAQEAKDAGLIDTFGRWADLKNILKDLDIIDNIALNESYLYRSKGPIDNKWKEKSSNIAVIYANGVCAMNSGIKARTLINDLKFALKNNSIKAVVLRVDSPGGDALASEYISNVIREYKNDDKILNKKPIIVSQGMLAASGGYWLSMDADQIVASPITITGSIGVISGWYYDKGISKDLGITTDLVQKGKYAGLGNSFREPLLGLGLPTSPLNDDERKQFENSIMRLYKDFVTKVAEGRNAEYDDIHKVAQGRIWSGIDGKENGLVDKIGGLAMAIEIAKKEAGISKDEKTNIYQYPTPPKFDLMSLISRFSGVNFGKIEDNISAFQFRLDNNGIPMPMLPLDYIQYEMNMDE